MDYTKSRILNLISKIHSLSSEYTRQFLSKKGDFASSHGFILYLLSQNDALSMSEIALSINRDKSTATVLIKKLAGEGLVETFTPSGDSRKKLVRLTQKGRNFNSFTQEISNSLLALCWKDFSEEEKDELLRLLQKMKSNLE